MTYGVVAIARTLDEASGLFRQAEHLDATMTLVVTEEKGLGTGGWKSGPVIVSRSWVNFGHNRSEAFALATGREHFDHLGGGKVGWTFRHCDWLLALDADMTVEIDPDFAPDPAVDCYLIEMGTAGLSWRLPLLLRGDLPWKSIGAVHEYTALPDRAYVGVPTDKVRITHPGANADADKLRWHASLLESDLPNGDPRTVFYLAQTYRDLGDPRAADLYEQRIAMTGGFEEERYVAAYALAALQPTWAGKLAALIRAWEIRPTRLEALYDAVHGLNNRGQHNAAWVLSSVPIEPTADLLFVWPQVWTWGLAYERWRAATGLGMTLRARRLAEQLLATAPDHIRHELREAA